MQAPVALVVVLQNWQRCATEIANRVADILGKQLVRILLTDHLGHFAGKLGLENVFVQISLA